ncbi:MAG: hypothetical protein SFV17_14455 [Candidatus Obscuribacter sp.]|nr:hypothetical protein [Candidatus Melainabacteria bacterium]MDX1987886.1 hypothetical protein [Candidatus Obscuribacter sp.]
MIEFSKGCAGGASDQTETEYLSSENAAALIRFVQDAWFKSRESFAQRANLDVADQSLEIKDLAESDKK